MMDKQLLACRIKAIRTKTGLKCVDFSKVLGFTKSAVSRWENGYCGRLNKSALNAFHDILGINPEYLTNPECDAMTNGKLKVEPIEDTKEVLCKTEKGSSSNVKHLLALSCLTKDKVCKCSGVQRREFNRLINGENAMSYKTLVRLSYFFDCSIEFLTGISDFWVGIKIVETDEKAIVKLSELLAIEDKIVITVESTGEESFVSFKNSSFSYGKFVTRRYIRMEDLSKLKSVMLLK